ncbi:MAG: hypothetical protein H0V18_03575 [Pyrinomonadaceae bacterium]|nr:hypothetical protein [Pyrinomonadaceae bacterium]
MSRTLSPGATYALPVHSGLVPFQSFDTIAAYKDTIAAYKMETPMRFSANEKWKLEMNSP